MLGTQIFKYRAIRAGFFLIHQQYKLHNDTFFTGENQPIRQKLVHDPLWYKKCAHKGKVFGHFKVKNQAMLNNLFTPKSRAQASPGKQQPRGTQNKK